VFAGVVILGLIGAVVLSAVSGHPAELPGIALGSDALLLAERTVALFAIWMLIAVVLIRAFNNQIPVEISGRGVRYAETREVLEKNASAEDVLRDVDVEIRWLRTTVLRLLKAQAEREGEGGRDAS
jgi:hypothetical protein